MSTETQLLIRLITRETSIAVPDEILSVPATIKVKGLNDLVNQLLSEHVLQTTTKEFDFLISNELLRSTLAEHLRDNSISCESTVDVEYIEKTPAPQPHKSIKHDDWVSSVNSCDDYVLTGCYDGSAYLWTNHGKLLTSQKEHTQAVKAVQWMQSNAFVTTSLDCRCVLWHWENRINEPKPLIVLKGHERSVDCVAVHTDSNKLATGSWDTFLKIWSANLDANDEEQNHNAKRSKGGNAMKVRVPICTLKGHKDAILGVDWIDKRQIATVSMDHTINIWNIEAGGMESTLAGQKAFICVAWSPLANLLLTGAADRHVRLYDPRSAEGNICKRTFTSHTNWVSSVKWSKYNANLFVSASYDSMVKMWDCRNQKAPLYNLEGHSDKIFSVDWSNDKYLVSGGADNLLHIFKNKMH